jgi:ACS family pantothenate transporter-like MFS transporter
MNEVAYLIQIWLPLIIWQQVSAPRYHKGFVTAACLSLALIGVCFLVRSLHNKELARKRAEKRGQESGSFEQEQDPSNEEKKNREPTVSELELLTKTKTSTSFSVSSSSSSSPNSSTRDRHADRNNRDIHSPSEVEAEGEMSIEMEARPAKVC